MPNVTALYLVNVFSIIIVISVLFFLFGYREKCLRIKVIYALVLSFPLLRFLYRDLFNAYGSLLDKPAPNKKDYAEK